MKEKQYINIFIKHKILESGTVDPHQKMSAFWYELQRPISR